MPFLRSYSGLFRHGSIRFPMSGGYDRLSHAVVLERQQSRFEAEQARLAVRAAKETLAASGEALANAREQLRLAEGRYR